MIKSFKSCIVYVYCIVVLEGEILFDDTYLCEQSFNHVCSKQHLQMDIRSSYIHVTCNNGAQEYFFSPKSKTKTLLYVCNTTIGSLYRRV